MNSKIDYSKKDFTEKEIQIIKSEVEALKKKYPLNIPIIVNYKNNIKLNKNKYLVNGDITVGQFLSTIRKRLQNELKSSEGLFLFVNNIIPPSSEQMSVLYKNHKDMKTGMLFFMLCAENTFGN